MITPGKGALCGLDAADVDFVLEHAADDLRELRGMRLLVTGGTGFVGKWLLETVLAANRRLANRTSVVVLTREPGQFREAFPRLAGDPAVALLEGDVTALATVERFDAIVHAATPASAAFNEQFPNLMLQTILEGMRSVLAVAEQSGNIPLLFTSSGAVYGRQPPEIPLVGEAYAGAPDPLEPKSAYYEGKRCAELLGAIAAARGVRLKVARMFAFVGPHLPLDTHFAVGNFIRDALAGGPIVIGGDGTPVRSYLYAADMTVWLWKIFVRGAVCRAYNVGSEHAVSLAALAEAVRDESGVRAPIEIRARAIPDRQPDRYVPSTARARTELGLQLCTPLDEAIRRTIAWHKRRRSSRAWV